MEQTIAPTGLEHLLRRDRAVTLASLLGASLLAWTYLLFGGGMDMRAMDGPAAMNPAMIAGWTPGYFALMLAMWAMMMVAMMLPSAAPMILLFAAIERRRGRSSPFAATALFALAYLVVWSGFSIAATLLQWLLERQAFASPAIAITSGAAASAVLVAAGIYQFTPLKQACLRGCRSPFELISRYWNDAPFTVGLRHGIYCVGCCWMIMSVLFVGGVMNLVWVAAIAAFVLVEKLAPAGQWLGYAAGVVLVGWGVWTLYALVAP